MTNNKDEGSWRGVLFSAALPLAVGLAMAAVIASAGCKRREPEAARQAKWVGMDRTKVRCAGDDQVFPHRQATCVGEGYSYKCVSEDGDEWRCAEVVAPRQLPDFPGAGLSFKCDYSGADQRRQVTCVVAGHTFKCLMDESRAWHCAEDPSPTAEMVDVRAGGSL